MIFSFTKYIINDIKLNSIMVYVKGMLLKHDSDGISRCRIALLSLYTHVL